MGQVPPTAPRALVCSCRRESTRPTPSLERPHITGPVLRPLRGPVEASGSGELRPEYRPSLLHTARRAFVLGYKSGFSGLRPVKRKSPTKWLLFSLLFQRRRCSHTGLTRCKPVAGLRPPCPRLLSSRSLLYKTGVHRGGTSRRPGRHHRTRPTVPSVGKDVGVRL